VIEIDVSGSTKKTQSFLDKMANLDGDIRSTLEAAGQRGVEALRSATPVDSGLTAMSWAYEVVEENGSISLYWTNTHVLSGVNIAIILQYGHGTGTGGWVSGRDYINPAINSIFDEIANDVWKKVTSA
jgi:hypothetical protein